MPCIEASSVAVGPVKHYFVTSLLGGLSGVCTVCVCASFWVCSPHGRILFGVCPWTLSGTAHSTDGIPLCRQSSRQIAVIRVAVFRFQ